MKNKPAAHVREVAPQHAHYWPQMDPFEWRGGPFSDRSSGLIIFESPDEKTAAETVADDPFQRAGLLEHWWLKTWEPVADDPP
jgi:uncharacterized protein YciI